MRHGKYDPNETGTNVIYIDESQWQATMMARSGICHTKNFYL